MSSPEPGAPPSPGTRRAAPPRRGEDGVWAWVAGRITGIAVFFFLFAHILDTALVRVSPDAYDTVMDMYKNPLAAVLEVLLVAAVLYHVLNGLRVIALDFWPKGAAYRRQLIWAATGLWFMIMVPVAVVMLTHSAASLFGSTS